MYYMNMTTETVTESAQIENQTVVASVQPTEKVGAKSRGRPKIEVQWPQGSFTFNSLNDVNALSSSSLRKKMRVELTRGGLVKVSTLKTAFGRPQNIYEKVVTTPNLPI